MRRLYCDVRKVWAGYGALTFGDIYVKGWMVADCHGVTAAVATAAVVVAAGAQLCCANRYRACKCNQEPA